MFVKDITASDAGRPVLSFGTPLTENDMAAQPWLAQEVDPGEVSSIEFEVANIGIVGGKGFSSHMVVP